MRLRDLLGVIASGALLLAALPVWAQSTPDDLRALRAALVAF